MFVHSGRENRLTNILRIIIHHHVRRFLDHVLEAITCHCHAFYIRKALVDLLCALALVRRRQVLPQVRMLSTKRVEGPIQFLFLLFLGLEHFRIGRMVYFGHIRHVCIVHSVSSTALVNHAIRITGILVRAVVHVAERVLHQFLVLIESVEREGVGRREGPLISSRLQLPLRRYLVATIEGRHLVRQVPVNAFRSLERHLQANLY